MKASSCNFVVIICVLVALIPYLSAINNTSEEAALEFLERYTTEGEKLFHDHVLQNWNLYTDLTEENQQKSAESAANLGLFIREMKDEVASFDLSALSTETRMQLELILSFSGSGLSGNKLGRLRLLGNQMTERYSTGKVCKGDDSDDCLPFDPDLETLMATSRNCSVLYWAWYGWRESVANQQARDDFAEYVSLLNEGSRTQGWADTGDKWRQTLYMRDDLKEETARLYAEIKPLFLSLHAYVRRKLYEYYGSDYVNLNGPIPSHLLGNMHPRAWTNIMDIVTPYPSKKRIDVTELIKAKNYTGLAMAKLADDFFKSLGMIPVNPRFFRDSMFEKPDDGRQVVCYPVAFDFYNKEDFRIKMCTDPSFEDFIILHHEMGHIQYFMQYKDLPLVFRNSPNPGFHEGIGDTIVLSTVTNKHLHTIGLLEELPEEDNETSINFLMQMALDNVAFMPFGYLIDLYRWKVFDGSIPPEKLNEEWWRMRRDLEGLIPPVSRNENNLDAVSYFHIAYDVPHIRYFVSRILTFQFHEALCNESGHTGPLHECDIYGSKAAGDLFSEFLSQGAKYPWDDTLEIITGQRVMSASSFLKYFQPLNDWLVKQNRLNEDEVGWSDEEWMPEIPPPLYYSAAGRLFPSLVIYCTSVFLKLFICH